ncbi:MAG: PAS domain-containing protein [Rhodospirillales bacterium]|nr:PAS domain-containing protein [Rhodospirillales bacterium]
MANQPPPLTGREQTFSDTQLIVTKTDPKGIIEYANELFIKVSGYSEEELLGKPHNMIRHPDMPRGVFKLLWESISSKRELYAYVVNCSKNGDHYWVLAHITPSFGSNGEISGYHSSRRAPNRKALDVIIPLYKQMKDEEAKYSNPKEAAQASFNFLRRILEEKGTTYEKFIYAIELNKN